MPEPEVACLSWADLNPESEVPAKPEYLEPEVPGPEMDHGPPTGPELEVPGPDVMLRVRASDPAIETGGKGTRPIRRWVAPGSDAPLTRVADSEALG